MLGRVLNTTLVITNKNSYHFQVSQVIFDAKELKLFQMRWVFIERSFFFKKKSITNRPETNAMQILFLYDTRMVSSESFDFKNFWKNLVRFLLNPQQIVEKW